MPKGSITKASFRDSINFILNDYTYKIHNIKRRDFVTRSLIIIVLKYKLNDNPQFIEYNNIKEEIEKTISIMTGNINTNYIKNFFYDMDKIDLDTDIDIEANSEINNIDDNLINNDLDNADLSGNSELSADFSNKDLLNNTEYVLSFDQEFHNLTISQDNEILNLDEGEGEDEVQVKDFDLNKIFDERGELNIFTLEKPYDEKLKKVFITDNDDDLGSLLDKINGVNLNKNKNKKKKK